MQNVLAFSISTMDRLTISAKAKTQAVRELIKATSKDRRYVKQLRKIGVSNYEIAKALGIPEDASVLNE